MGNPDLPPGAEFGSEANVKISSGALIAVVIFIFLIVIFAFSLYIYARTNWVASSSTNAPVGSTGGEPITPRRGLESGVLRSLPVTIFKRCDFKDGTECAVCLSDFSEGEKVRLLPKCKHIFHLECIDMWLFSNFTCPICRFPVGPEDAAAGEDPAAGMFSLDSPAFSTNVTIRGNHDRIYSERFDSHSARSLVISIPNRFMEELPSPIMPLESSKNAGESLKSPVEEVRSSGVPEFELSRILSRGKRSGDSSSSSPVQGDMEKGMVICRVTDEEGSSNLIKSPGNPSLAFCVSKEMV